MEEQKKEPEKEIKVCGNCTKFKKFYLGKGKFYLGKGLPLKGYCFLKETDVKTDSTCQYHEEVH